MRKLNYLLLIMVAISFFGHANAQKTKSNEDTYYYWIKEDMSKSYIESIVVESYDYIGSIAFFKKHKDDPDEDENWLFIRTVFFYENEDFPIDTWNVITENGNTPYNTNYDYRAEVRVMGYNYETWVEKINLLPKQIVDYNTEGIPDGGNVHEGGTFGINLSVSLDPYNPRYENWNYYYTINSNNGSLEIVNGDTNSPDFNCVGDTYNENLSIDITVQNSSLPNEYIDIWNQNIDLTYYPYGDEESYGWIKDTYSKSNILDIINKPSQDIDIISVGFYMKNKDGSQWSLINEYDSTQLTYPLDTWNEVTDGGAISYYQAKDYKMKIYYSSLSKSVYGYFNNHVQLLPKPNISYDILGSGHLKNEGYVCKKENFQIVVNASTDPVNSRYENWNYYYSINNNQGSITMENENTNHPGFNCIGDNYNEDLSIDLTVQNNDFPSNYFDVWVDSIDVIYRIANNPVVSYGSGNGYYCRGENINLVSGDSAYWMYQGTVEGVSRVYEIQNLQEDKTINAFIMSDYGCLSDTVSKTVHASKVKARFEANMNVIEDGQRVDFTNNSTGSHYSWNFGDGSLINHETNPKHYYYGSGKYDVTLVAKDTLDCIDSLVKINYIIVESEEDTSGGDDSTVTAITNFGVKNLEIYPIPAGDKLFIDSDKMITRYELLSFEGKLIQEKAINRKRKVIHMSKLAAGIYVLNIYYGNQRITHKIIKK